MWLKAFLDEQKITVAAFGAMIDVPNKQTASRYVRGERFPPPDVLMRIREVTSGRVTADDFVDQHIASAAPAAP